MRSGSGASAHDLLRAARRCYAEAGGGDGALLATCLTAVLAAQEGDPGAAQELAAILAEARTTQDQRVAEPADAALRAVRKGRIPRLL